MTLFFIHHRYWWMDEASSTLPGYDLEQPALHPIITRRRQCTMVHRGGTKSAGCSFAPNGTPPGLLPYGPRESPELGQPAIRRSYVHAQASQDVGEAGAPSPCPRCFLQVCPIAAMGRSYKASPPVAQKQSGASPGPQPPPRAACVSRLRANDRASRLTPAPLRSLPRQSR
jgi:hypothetical protein